ncbi:hypothetical protein AVEN_126303-1 [Araneus ventricosus]|uniref:Uncharacterized protein n=1 Tax=Araneus ventricosus TaxID=182803 RepID=A0A4Y2I1Y6_ARAVE|nr:hypothetical protein AVEN_126303-1 [Araneus ventricosus]
MNNSHLWVSENPLATGQQGTLQHFSISVWTATVEDCLPPMSVRKPAIGGYFNTPASAFGLALWKVVCHQWASENPPVTRQQGTLRPPNKPAIQPFALLQALIRKVPLAILYCVSDSMILRKNCLVMSTNF